MIIGHHFSRVRLGVAVVAALVCSSCKPPPASSPTDGLQLVACVSGQLAQGIRDPVAIGISCNAPEQAVVLDVISMLDKHAAKMSKCAPPATATDGGVK
jgi:hypothetical protein